MPRLLAALLLIPAAAHADPPQFGVEVRAVLARAGCNQGTCHGNLNGKGGFKLSLRGEDPAWDRLALTRDAFGRRIDIARPDSSLVLLKATASIPHEGGRRFDRTSPEYRILRDWIASGASADPPGAPALASLTVTPSEQTLVEPADRVRLAVRATFTDGAARDVTGLSVFDTTSIGVAEVASDGAVTRQRFGEAVVMVRFLDRQATARLAFVPARPGFAWSNPPEANFIDHHVFAKLKALRVNPSEVCDDATFLRRVYLDTLGVPPTVAEARLFLADVRPDKRSRLIDALLARPEFADYWALKWSDLLRNEEKQLDRKGVRAFRDWIRTAIAEGRPLNEFARDLIAGRGSTYASPAANYYRALRDPLTRAEATAQVFLGVRLQCAKCHNHPFDSWTQDDYFRWAALFARVQYRIVQNNRRDKFDKHEFDGEQVVWLDRDSETTHPRTGQAVAPRFLGAPADLAAADRLLALADWVADPANPFFAKAQANRVWGHLLGRGLVEPNDDFRATNPPTHPELLDALARDFAAHRFDLRHLVRTILLSRTYQLSWQPNDTNRDDEANFARSAVRPLEAEPLLDALARAAGVPVKFEGQPSGVRAGQLPGVQLKARGTPSAAERFLKAFGKPERLLSCDCERSDDPTVVRAFQLLTGEVVTTAVADPDNRIGRLLADRATTAAAVEELYLAALARYPSATEAREASSFVDRAADRRAALEDVLWALLNSKEFQVRR